MISLHKYPTISQSFLGVLKVYRRAWNTIIEKLVKKKTHKTLKVKLCKNLEFYSDQRYGKQIYNSVKCIFDDYSTNHQKKITKINVKIWYPF